MGDASKSYMDLAKRIGGGRRSGRARVARTYAPGAPVSILAFFEYFTQAWTRYFSPGKTLTSVFEVVAQPTGSSLFIAAQAAPLGGSSLTTVHCIFAAS